MRVLVSLGLLLIGAAQAAAMIPVTMTYTEYARLFRLQLEEIAAGHGLTASETEQAIRFATAWLWIGPCEGDSRRLSQDPISLLQFFSLPNFGSPFTSATFAMVGLAFMENLGRGSLSENLCTFAIETAEPLTR